MLDNEQREVLRDSLHNAISSVQITDGGGQVRFRSRIRNSSAQFSVAENGQLNSLVIFQSNRGGLDLRHYHICSSVVAMALLI